MCRAGVSPMTSWDTAEKCDNCKHQCMCLFFCNLSRLAQSLLIQNNPRSIHCSVIIIIWTEIPTCLQTTQLEKATHPSVKLPMSGIWFPHTCLHIHWACNIKITYLEKANHWPFLFMSLFIQNNAKYVINQMCTLLYLYIDRVTHH